MLVDAQRVLAEQERRRRGVQIGLDLGRAEEGLAEPDQPLVGVHAHPDEVGELAEPHRLEGGDLHRFPPSIVRADLASSIGGKPLFASPCRREAAHTSSPVGSRACTHPDGDAAGVPCVLRDAPFGRSSG